MQLILPTSYLPPVSYFAYIMQADHVLIEKHEYFVKQTIRNRCNIAAANGQLSLSIPLLSGGKTTAEKKISYAENWQAVHWRSIVSAYKSSPFFEYLEADFKPFYENRFEYLVDFNTALIFLLLKLLKLDKEITFTDAYLENPDAFDLRSAFDLKKKLVTLPEYYQVFRRKNGFLSDLSIIDLLFNEGLHAKTYLQQPDLHIISRE